MNSRISTHRLEVHRITSIANRRVCENAFFNQNFYSLGNGSIRADSLWPPTGVVTPQPPVTPPAPPPAPPTGDGSPEGQAGAGFAASFRQGSFDEPTDPVEGDIIPLDKTTDPFDIPNP